MRKALFTAGFLMCMTGSACASSETSLLSSLRLADEPASVLAQLSADNPGLASALVAMRANKICRGVQLSESELLNALAVFSGALSPSLRTDPNVSHGRMEREHIQSLSALEPTLAVYRRTTPNCFEIELKAQEIREDLRVHGSPLAVRLANVLQQTPASSEITVEQPVVNVIVQEAPQPSVLQMVLRLLPWNW